MLKYKSNIYNGNIVHAHTHTHIFKSKDLIYLVLLKVKTVSVYICSWQKATVIKSKDLVYSLCTQLVVIKSKDCLYTELVKGQTVIESKTLITSTVGRDIINNNR